VRNSRTMQVLSNYYIHKKKKDPPLPLFFFLPVYVDGYFSLASNPGLHLRTTRYIGVCLHTYLVAQLLHI